MTPTLQYGYYWARQKAPLSFSRAGFCMVALQEALASTLADIGRDLFPFQIQGDAQLTVELIFGQTEIALIQLAGLAPVVGGRAVFS